VILEIGLKEVQSRERYKEVLNRVRQWHVALIEQNKLTPTERVEAGRTLAYIGDPRETVILPERMGFCLVSAGPFWMGSEEYGDEKPFRLNECLDYDYWISRYPVTNAQFKAFVQSGGYKEERYWKVAQAADLWDQGKVKHGIYNFDKKGKWKRIKEIEVEGPEDYGEPFNLPNHPVVGITWYEALAFTLWLSERIEDKIPHGYEIHFPSEAEWEKAARGGVKIPANPTISRCDTWTKESRLIDNPIPKRYYPWNNDEADPNRANYIETRIGTTSAAGCFPGGTSPYGVLDMSGNVWEWTRSLWGEDWKKPKFKYPYLKDDRENLEAGKDILRMLRGGSFNNNERNVRCANRNRNNPDNRNRNIGFRVVVSTFFHPAGIALWVILHRRGVKNGGACPWPRPEQCRRTGQIATAPPPRLNPGAGHFKKR
jgi:formylglycine-generating enzyme required for sulfatase activity